MRHLPSCKVLLSSSGPRHDQPHGQLKTKIRCKTLLGIWAAEKLGLAGGDADGYARELAVGTLDAELSDVLSKIRAVRSNEQILRVMEEFMLEASAQMPKAGGSSLDGAEAMLMRKITSR